MDKLYALFTDPGFYMMVALTTAVVEAIKRAVHLKTDYCPLLSMFIGVCFTFLLGSNAYIETAFMKVIAGVGMGLMGSGLFDVIAKTPAATVGIVRSTIGKLGKR
jgi:hypothetical protein